MYALGVAGLASERLLQKHAKRAATPATSTVASNKHDSIVVEYESASSSASLLLNKIFATIAAKLVLWQRQVAVRRSVMLRALLGKSKLAGKAALASVPRLASNLGRGLVKAGGGERNLKVAATIMCAFAIYFAQPIIKGAITRTQV